MLKFIIGDMMNIKGFTLVELVAIIVVFAAIFLVSFPTILNMSKTEENKKLDNMVENLCAAGKTYMYANMNQYPELSLVDSEIEIKISTLINDNIVDDSIVNPKTNISVNKDKLSYKVLSDFSLECKYIEV